jgi:hypothetical protein
LGSVSGAGGTAAGASALAGGLSAEAAAAASTSVLAVDGEGFGSSLSLPQAAAVRAKQARSPTQMAEEDGRMVATMHPNRR